ncbi:MAG: hypothetical protein AAF914_03410, partial [Pseudomonadota bacterium]
GLGIAVTLVVSGGLQTLSTDISDALGGVEVQTRFAEALADLGFAVLDFAGDAGPFSGGTVVDLPGIGEVLQIAGEDTAEASFDLPPGTTEATVEFDLFGLDTLNNEEATITVNGAVAGQVFVDNGVATFVPVNGGSSTFQAFTVSDGSDLTGNGFDDSHTQVRLTVANPGDTLDVGVFSGAQAGIDNESFAIDNVHVSAN